MSRADFDKWQARHRGSDGTVRPVDPFLDEIADRLPRRGRALDVAGGRGRHALWLAGRGLDVTLVDVAPAALALARGHAAKRGLSLETVALDVDSAPLPDGPFAVILVAWFVPGASLWPTIVDRLEPGGLLVHVHPTVTNLDRHEKPSRRFLTTLDDARGALTSLELDVAEEGWDTHGHHTARLVARRPSRG